MSDSLSLDSGAEMRCVVKCRVLLPSHITTPPNNPHRVAFKNNDILKGLNEWKEKGLHEDRFWALVKEDLLVPVDAENLEHVLLAAKAVKPPVAIGSGMNVGDTDTKVDELGLPITGNDPSKKDGWSEQEISGRSDSELKSLAMKNFPQLTAQIAVMARAEVEDLLSGNRG